MELESAGWTAAQEEGSCWLRSSTSCLFPFSSLSLLRAPLSFTIKLQFPKPTRGRTDEVFGYALSPKFGEEIKK